MCFWNTAEGLKVKQCASPFHPGASFCIHFSENQICDSCFKQKRIRCLSKALAPDWILSAVQLKEFNFFFFFYSTGARVLNVKSCYLCSIWKLAGYIGWQFHMFK